MAIAQRQLTLDEFLRLPEEKPALEFEEGMVTRKVPPKGQHSGLQSELVEVFNRFGRPRKLARAFPELRATYGGRSYVPDVSVYRAERIPRDAAGRIANDFREPPDVAVEIVSPKQRITPLVRRCLWYVANGVQIALLIDPDDESILVFRSGQPTAAVRGPDPIDLSDVLPGLTLTAQELFDSLRS